MNFSIKLPSGQRTYVHYPTDDGIDQVESIEGLLVNTVDPPSSEAASPMSPVENDSVSFSPPPCHHPSATAPVDSVFGNRTVEEASSSSRSCSSEIDAPLNLVVSSSAGGNFTPGSASSLPHHASSVSSTSVNLVDNSSDAGSRAAARPSPLGRRPSRPAVPSSPDLVAAVVRENLDLQQRYNGLKSCYAHLFRETAHLRRYLGDGIVGQYQYVVGLRHERDRLLVERNQVVELLDSSRAELVEARQQYLDRRDYQRRQLNDFLCARCRTRISDRLIRSCLELACYACLPRLTSLH